MGHATGSSFAQFNDANLLLQLKWDFYDCGSILDFGEHLGIRPGTVEDTQNRKPSRKTNERSRFKEILSGKSSGPLICFPGGFPVLDVLDCTTPVFIKLLIIIGTKMSE